MFRKLLTKLKSFIERRYLYSIIKSNLLTKLYYTFFSSSFVREEKAVLAGRYFHVRNLEHDSDYYLLIRNVHRIEKGLIMRPRKDEFATDYILPTTQTYKRLQNSGLFKDTRNDQLQWFNDVLNLYFQATAASSNLFITKARDIFTAMEREFQQTSLKAPFARSKSAVNNICYDDFFALTKRRRSVRWFLQKPVEVELINKALLAGLQSPSACNRQPFEYRIFTDYDKVQSVASIPMGTRGYVHNIPAVVVLVGNLDAYFDERDRHLIYIDSALSAMSFTLALETLGLSSCLINWPDIEEKEAAMSKILNLKRFQRPIMLIAIGYADPEGYIPFSEKKSLDIISKFN